jgi:outer membrane receptor protein involved in Fe transport
MYHQNSRNYAFFTHNIFHITDKVAFTAGLRYTNERKRFHATFGQDNTACPAQQAALDGFLTNPALAAVAGGLLALTCQGNATSELNGVTIVDRRSEHKLTGTGVLSWKPVEDLMMYASYSRGYKAGGFNLDRSALKSPLLPFAATPGGAQALVGNLQFDPEINNAYEVGAKYSHGVVTANLAIFRQDFRNFQLNTFNGTVFLVQTINGCKTNLAGADRDLSATTGACAAGDVTWGVRSQGVELETAFRPTRDLDITAGFTYANTKYRSNLVGNSSGVPLDPALRELPGKHLSNAPGLVGTTSMTWTPRIGGSGLHGLFYVDARLTSDYNTGSDLFPQKRQDAYALVNARIGLRGPRERWALEFWAQPGLCPGRLQHTVPGGRDVGPVRRSAIPGRPPDLLGLPGGTEDLRRHRPLPLLRSAGTAYLAVPASVLKPGQPDRLSLHAARRAAAPSSPAARSRRAWSAFSRAGLSILRSVTRSVR